jgi:tRNA pseudouridine55 synthase
MSATLAPGKRAPWESGLVIVDKPGGLTSHDVVARIRRLAGTRRVGHAGTLDPMATGVLVIGVEKATRLLGYLMLTEKEYAATIRLGQSTLTDDAEGEPVGGAPAAVGRAAIDAGIARLTGPIMQVPPGVSAIKVNGERAYKLTRAGAAPELAARPVTVYSFTVTSVTPAGDFLDIDAVIRCSSGTYIRALARDLGAGLGVGGHLTALRRTAVGPYAVGQAHTLEELENKDPAEERTGPAPVPASAPAAVSWVIPLAQAAAAAFPRLDLAAADARRLAQGARLPLTLLPPPTDPAPPLASAAPGSAPSDSAAPHISPAPGAPVPSPALGAPVPSTAPAAPAPLADSAASVPPGAPIAAFAPDGTLVALVTAESGSLRSLAVFVDAQGTPARP